MKRIYCDGKLSRSLLNIQLALGYVLIDVVPNGYSGGDVAYFRCGTSEELAECRAKLEQSHG